MRLTASVVAPSVVQSASTANAAVATSVAATFTTSPAPGDLLLAGLSYYFNGSPSPIKSPAGWTKLSEGVQGNTGLGVYYRYAQAGDGRTWTWVSRMNDYLSLGLVDFVNVAPGSVPAIVTDVTQPNSTTPTTPTLTPAVAGSLPIGLFGINIGRVGPQTFTPGSGFTTILSPIPLYHALGIEQGVVTSTAVRATATLHASSQLSTALVLLAPATAATPPPSGFVDWTTYGFDNHRSGFSPSSGALTPASLGGLHLAWQQFYSDNDTQTQPVLATNIGSHAGLLFVGGTHGIVYAFDALTGARVWQTPLGTQKYACPGRLPTQLGIGGTVAYDPGSRTIYVGDNVNASANAPATNSIVRLDATTGALLGSVPIATSALAGESNVTHTSITLANGFAYAGTGAFCDLSSWRGRVAAVDAGTSGLVRTFFTAYGVGGNFSGAGVWSWGGVAVDDGGSVYATVGNTDTTQGTSGPKPPFQGTTNEHAGYGEHVVKISGDLSTGVDSNFPGGNIGTIADLDFSGTPVLFTPVGCSDTLLAAQGKAGEVLVYDTLSLGTGPIARFRISPTSGDGADIGNPAWSPSTGMLYVNVSSGRGGSIDPPGMIALRPSGCNGSTAFSVAWHTAFGPDSFSGAFVVPRSSPTVTAGGVVLSGTGCAANTNGSCNATLGSTFGGALWALDATTGALLNNGKPVLLTSAHIRAPPVVDGAWVFVQDETANLYGMTLLAGVKPIQGRHAPMIQTPTWSPNR